MEYTVKRGDTLNAIAQAQGFKNYKEAGITSVPSGNFDLIRPGEKIVIGAKKPAEVASTTVDTSGAGSSVVIPPISGSGATSTGRDMFDFNSYQTDIATQKADLEKQKEINRQAMIDAINNKYNTRITGVKTLGEEEQARTRALNLRSGIIGSEFGSAETSKTSKKTQDAINAEEAAKSAEITAAINDLDKTYYERSRNVATDKLNELKTGNELRTASIEEQNTRKAPVTTILKNLALKGVTYDQFKLDPSYANVSKDFTDNELQALFITSAPSNTFLSDKPEIVGSNAVWFQKQADGTVKAVKVDLGVDSASIKDIVKTDNGIYVFKTDGSYNVVGAGSMGSTQDEYAKAQKFVKDNPNATPLELEQGIRASTKNLSDADIKSLTQESTTLNRANIAKLYGITDDSTKTGFLGFGKTNAEKLDEIMKSIDQYKAVGTSDADIIKLIKG